MPYQPDRGDFVFVDFTPQAGIEIAGRRPALVLSPAAFNTATGRAFVCPVTNQVKGGSFEVPIPAGTKVTGVVVVDQLRSLDWLARRAEPYSRAPKEMVVEVLARIEAILGLDLG
jgi:mRNA interferase MazF